jgi:hypothetical protein
MQENDMRLLRPDRYGAEQQSGRLRHQSSHWVTARAIPHENVISVAWDSGNEVSSSGDECYVLSVSTDGREETVPIALSSIGGDRNQPRGSRNPHEDI